MSRGLDALTLTGAVGSGLVGGVFFAFSTFVMDGLRRLPPAQGIAAMQSINRAAPSPAFMAALFGTSLVSVALIVAAVRGWDEDAAPWLLAGGALYMVGTTGLTLAYHVPRNEALARVDPDGGEAAGPWARYASRWTAANHVRAAAALAAAAALTVGLRVG